MSTIIFAAAGCWLILQALASGPRGILNGVMFRAVPALLGGVTLFASAVHYIGGSL
jgi:hypothetical protein